MIELATDLLNVASLVMMEVARSVRWMLLAAIFAGLSAFAIGTIGLYLARVRRRPARFARPHPWAPSL
jgi:hypothetical protein